MSTKSQKCWTVVLSIAIPLAVAMLFNIRIDTKPLSFLPPIYATINGITAVLLIFAVIAVKNKKYQLHERIIKICIALSILFLGMYVAYHMTSNPTPYKGQGILKSVYYFILITHILLSIGVIPLVLTSYFRASVGMFKRHRKIAKITFPIWLYVAVTGVIVYIMIAPYYVQK